MAYTQALRAIGQALEGFGVTSFTLDKDKRFFTVQPLTVQVPRKAVAKPNLAEKVWEMSNSERHAKVVQEDGTLRFDASYLAWVEAQGKRKRRRRFSSQATSTRKLSQLMRTLGRHIDRLEPPQFHVHWGESDIEVKYQLADGSELRESLTTAKLRGLALRARFRRAPRK